MGIGNRFFDPRNRSVRARVLPVAPRRWDRGRNVAFAPLPGVWFLKDHAADSGGAALRQSAVDWELVGKNTFTEDYGDRFGDTGVGVLVEPYIDWAYGITGIPESGSALIWGISAVCLVWRREKRLNKNR